MTGLDIAAPLLAAPRLTAARSKSTVPQIWWAVPRFASVGTPLLPYFCSGGTCCAVVGGAGVAAGFFTGCVARRFNSSAGIFAGSGAEDELAEVAGLSVPAM